MRAVVYQRYGSPDVLRLERVARPTVSADGVLVRVRAASVNRSDWETLTGSPAYVRLGGAGLFRPKHAVLGSDIAGTVEAVGEEVTRFRPGDEVFGDTMYFGMGGFAEYVAVPDRAPLAPKPAWLSFEEAAALPQAAVLAVQGLRLKDPVEPGQRVLIIGAGGGGGTFAVQVAKAQGAEVTAVDNALKLETMRSLGAADVVDYARDDFAKQGRRYHRILDFVAPRSLFAYRRVLEPGGLYIVVGGPMRRLIKTATLGFALSKVKGKRMRVLAAKPNRDDLVRVAELVEAGTIRPVIHHRYPLEEVPEALRALGRGEVVGKAVISVSGG